VAVLSGGSRVFQDAPAMAEELGRLLNKPLADILERQKALIALVDQRNVVKQEVEHYREKVTRLANDGLANAKAQDKAESNQQKLHAEQQRLLTLDKDVAEALEKLDAELAATTDAALTAVRALRGGLGPGRGVSASAVLDGLLAPFPASFAWLAHSTSRSYPPSSSTAPLAVHANAR
jgi:chromosome segregation ATPase